jgi:plasmid stabilization system protein ParE
VAQIVYSPTAIASLERLYDFLVEKNPDAAQRAIGTILRKLRALEQFPHLGPVDVERPDVRQLFMPFGAAGYVARYRIADDSVVILAIRHTREAGYGDDLPMPSSPTRPSRRRS